MLFLRDEIFQELPQEEPHKAITIVGHNHRELYQMILYRVRPGHEVNFPVLLRIIRPGHVWPAGLPVIHDHLEPIRVRIQQCVLPGNRYIARDRRRTPEDPIMDIQRRLEIVDHGTAHLHVAEAAHHRLTVALLHRVAADLSGVRLLHVAADHIAVARQAEAPAHAARVHPEAVQAAARLPAHDEVIKET